MIKGSVYNLRRVAGFKVRPRQPYSFELTLRKPAGWSWFTPNEIWTGGKVFTGFWYRPAGGLKFPIGLCARSVKNEVSVSIYSSRSLDKDIFVKLRANIIKTMGAEEDISSLYRLMRKHPVLKHLVRRLYGMHEAWGGDIFPSLTLAVLLQMAPIKRSQDMWACLISQLGDIFKFENVSVRIWPREEVIARQSKSSMAGCKLGFRARHLILLARQLLKGFPAMEELAAMSPQQAEEKLTELYGIGEYSASFATPHPSFSLDVWSVKIFHRLIFGRAAPAKDPRSAIEKTNRAAEKLWGRWRGYVLTYVLNDLPYLEKEFGITA